MIDIAKDSPIRIKENLESLRLNYIINFENDLRDKRIETYIFEDRYESNWNYEEAKQKVREFPFSPQELEKFKRFEKKLNNALSFWKLLEEKEVKESLNEYVD